MSEKKKGMGYPENLLQDVFDRTTYEMPEITEDTVAGIEYAAGAMDNRRLQILLMYYRDGKTLREIAEFFCISPSRASGLKRETVAKLHRAKYVGYLLYGKQGYEEHLEKHRLEQAAKRDTEEYKHIMDIRFEDLDLSVRSFNSLRRAGYTTIGDIINLSEEEILNIKSISWKQYDEIGKVLMSRGVVSGAWLGFIFNK